ncbi:LysE family translocator [Martelella lutilitoris]|uniref:LysE family translocator n=1 Tax=Martelella lutilitoris TaxID=2583532 RepID=A0A7T7KMB9_9HYPH|nr:LysE family translocator [Martelella lutilitoris]QQM31652.1 LysE family translocator [Martelella lutilitoris]
MDWSSVAAFAATEFLLCLSPGPAVLLVVGLSMRQGFWRSQVAAAGILATNALYFALSAAGVASLILMSATLFNVVKIVGAVYLAYLGIKMIAPLLSRRKGEGGSALADAANLKRVAPEAPFRLFFRGFSVQAANPKNLAFFVAILPQFVNPAGDVAMQMLVFGGISVLLELPILIIYALAFSALARVVTERVVAWLEASAGGILVMLGAALALQKKA